MAAAPLTKTTSREQEVTFIDPPFMTFDLAMLMKKSHKSSSVRNIRDLSKAEKMKYGVVASGSTYNFFHYSRDKDYRKMKVIMDGRGNNSKVANIEVGVKQVRESTDDEPFVFIGEQYTMEYHASRAPCDLTTVNGNVTRPEFVGEYHLAVRKQLESDVKTKLAEALTKLKESGKLEELYKKWWVERTQCSGAPSSAFNAGIAVLVPIVVALFRVSGE